MLNDSFFIGGWGSLGPPRGGAGDIMHRVFPYVLRLDGRAGRARASRPPVARASRGAVAPRYNLRT
jgi:hypothetical protein